MAKILYEDNDTWCLYCNVVYGETSEDWIWCDLCKQWVHENCSDYADETEVFIVMYVGTRHICQTCPPVSDKFGSFYTITNDHLLCNFTL